MLIIHLPFPRSQLTVKKLEVEQLLGRVTRWCCVNLPEGTDVDLLAFAFDRSDPSNFFPAIKSLGDRIGIVKLSVFNHPLLRGSLQRRKQPPFQLDDLHSVDAECVYITLDSPEDEHWGPDPGSPFNQVDW